MTATASMDWYVCRASASACRTTVTIARRCSREAEFGYDSAVRLMSRDLRGNDAGKHFLAGADDGRCCLVAGAFDSEDVGHEGRFSVLGSQSSVGKCPNSSHTGFRSGQHFKHAQTICERSSVSRHAVVRVSGQDPARKCVVPLEKFTTNDFDGIVETARHQLFEHCGSRGHQAYLVGGCVRDMVLGREPADYDVTTDATPDQVMRIFPSKPTL